MIDKRAREITDRQERNKDLETKIYRNPSPCFYDYQKKKEYATVLHTGNLLLNNKLNY